MTDENVADSALARHVARFTNPDHTYSPSTVNDGLEKIHGHQTLLKGTVIATFNATHPRSGCCPVIHGDFTPDQETGFAKNLHLGTTRVWNADGSINEERWNKFLNFASSTNPNEEEQVFTWSKVKEYLIHCYNTDLSESSTGRHSSGIFGSSKIQSVAAMKAWEEVFDRLACGWSYDKEGKLEPYITVGLVREFFVDSTRAFDKSERGELPVDKPETLCPFNSLAQ